MNAVSAADRAIFLAEYPAARRRAMPPPDTQERTNSGQNNKALSRSISSTAL